jgi:hypothetical protein
MNKDSLQRLIATHRAFAAVSQSHLRRHWRRELSREEIDTVHSFTLCASVLALESVERSLSLSAGGADADRYFYLMQSEVAARGPQVVTALRSRVAGAARRVPAPARSQNLLAWEESLLAWLN